MKNILILRSANYKVMDMLLQKISKENYIYCIMQKSAVNFFEEKYPYIKPLVLNEEYIGFHDFMNNVKMPDIKFDVIYLPTSSKNFGAFGEILCIIEELKYKELVYFDRDGIEKRKIVTLTSKLKECALANIFRFFFRSQCFFYGIKKRIIDNYFLGE